MISGVKSYNNSVNVTDGGRPVKTLFHELQEQGWKLGTVTSVPFDHVSPAAMYAQDVDRDDYQDLAREMLGLPGILQQARGAPRLPGLDVVMGAGFGITSQAATMAPQGKNWVPGNVFIADPDLAAIDVKNGGKYVVVHTEPLASGARGLGPGRQGRRPSGPRASSASSAARGSIISRSGPPTAGMTPRPASAARARRPRRRSTPRPTGSSSRPWPR